MGSPETQKVRDMRFFVLYLVLELLFVLVALFCGFRVANCLLGIGEGVVAGILGLVIAILILILLPQMLPTDEVSIKQGHDPF